MFCLSVKEREERKGVEFPMLVNCDWLQLHCLADHFPFTPQKFTIVEREFGSRYFQFSADVFFGEEVVATIEYGARGCALSPQSVIIKYRNNVLYLSGALRLIWDVLNDLQLTYQSTTRIDLAIDFQHTPDFDDPANIVKAFARDEIICATRQTYQINGYSDKGAKPLYFRLGARKSDVKSYLYNKSVELKAVHDKPYIRERWARAFGSDTSDVWRLEFSITHSKFAMVTNTGEFWSCELWEDVFNETSLPRIVKFLISKYFCFRYPSEDKNITRWEKVNLFDTAAIKVSRYKMTEESECTRKDRLALSYIIHLRETSNYIDDNTEDCLSIIEDWIVHKKNLQSYAERKHEEYKTEGRC